MGGAGQSLAAARNCRQSRQPGCSEGEGPRLHDRTFDIDQCAGEGVEYAIEITQIEGEASGWARALVVGRVADQVREAARIVFLNDQAAIPRDRAALVSPRPATADLEIGIRGFGERCIERHADVGMAGLVVVSVVVTEVLLDIESEFDLLNGNRSLEVRCCVTRNATALAFLSPGGWRLCRVHLRTRVRSEIQPAIRHNPPSGVSGPGQRIRVSTSR